MNKKNPRRSDTARIFDGDSALLVIVIYQMMGNPSFRITRYDRPFV